MLIIASARFISVALGFIYLVCLFLHFNQHNSVNSGLSVVGGGAFFAAVVVVGYANVINDIALIYFHLSFIFYPGLSKKPESEKIHKQPNH